MASSRAMNPDLFAHAETQPPAPLTQGELEAIAADHLRWTGSEGREGKRANLRGADLRQCRFENMVFAEASFRNADVSGVTIQASDLRGADFAESRLEGASFTECQLEHASFARAYAPQCGWHRSSLIEADFSGAVLSSARMEQCETSGASFRETQMANLHARDSHFTNAVMRGAMLQEALFTSCDFSSAELRDAYCANAQFDQCRLQETLLRGADLSGVDLSQSDFSAAHEVEPVYYMQYIAAARETLAREQTALGNAREILARERDDVTQESETNARERQDIDTQMLQAEHLHDRLRGAGRFFTLAALLWTLLSFAMLALIGSSLNGPAFSILQPEEQALIGVTLGLPLILFTTAAFRAFASARALTRFREGEM